MLFLVAPNDRKMRIEVGYGLEGTLTDALSKVILASAVAPKFKSGDFGAGVERGVEGIIEVSERRLGGMGEESRARRRPLFEELFPLIIFALFVFIFIMMVRGGGGPTSYRTLPPRRSAGHHHSVESSTRDDFGGSSGGSSWGGGGGGFDGFSGGGGSSGGGGASGDW